MSDAKSQEFLRFVAVGINRQYPHSDIEEGLTEEGQRVLNVFLPDGTHHRLVVMTATHDRRPESLYGAPK